MNPFNSCFVNTASQNQPSVGMFTYLFTLFLIVVVDLLLFCLFILPLFVVDHNRRQHKVIYYNYVFIHFLSKRTTILSHTHRQDYN